MGEFDVVTGGKGDCLQWSVIHGYYGIMSN